VDRHLVPETFPPRIFAHPNTMNVNDLLELDVTDFALGGKGLARHVGRAVFVDRGLPGDRVVARVTRVKRAWAEAWLDRVESSTAQRVDAACPHFVSGVCGDCRARRVSARSQSPPGTERSRRASCPVVRRNWPSRGAGMPLPLRGGKAVVCWPRWGAEAHPAHGGGLSLQAGLAAWRTRRLVRTTRRLPWHTTPLPGSVGARTCADPA